jgi:hypothetical protein
MSDNEGNVVDDLMALRHCSGCEYANVPKYLFGEIPMLRCRPSTDIGWIKKLWDQYPRILKSVVGGFGFDGNGHVNSSFDVRKPALTTPSRKRLGRVVLVQPEYQSCFLDGQ